MESKPTVEVERFGMPHELHEGQKTEAKITVDRPAAEVFAFCRDISNLKRIMPRLKRAEWATDGTSYWIYETANGESFEWEAELIAETQNRMISWRTTRQSPIHHAGSIWFLPQGDDERTELHVLVQCACHGRDLSRWIEEDLRHLKDLIESTRRTRSPE